MVSLLHAGDPDDLPRWAERLAPNPAVSALVPDEPKSIDRIASSLDPEPPELAALLALVRPPARGSLRVGASGGDPAFWNVQWDDPPFGVNVFDDGTCCAGPKRSFTHPRGAPLADLERSFADPAFRARYGLEKVHEPKDHRDLAETIEGNNILDAVSQRIILMRMKNAPAEPQTLIEAIRYFADPDVALATMVELRWPNGVTCPTCGRGDVRFIATRRLWECKERHPCKQFSAKVGTIFEDSPIDLGKWFAAIWMVANCKNGISSYEMHRALGVTQKTAWFMDHRIRLAMKTGSFLKMSGPVEADETFIGGLSKNMHASRRKRVIGNARGHVGKETVVGLLRRTDKATGSKSKVTTEHIPNVQGDTLRKKVRETVETGSRLYTDEWVGYRGLDDYEHFVINHAVAYVEDHVHTNGIENFWSLLKRTIKGTYVSVEPFHLGRYLDEQTFRFNEREHTDGVRFRKVASSVAGRRLTYAELTGKHDASAKPN